MALRQLKKYDVVIAGGGPAGSSMACYLRQAGLSCLILEREAFPRAHVGESLVPASNRVLREIEVLPKIESAGFTKKLGAAWATHLNKQIYSVDFEGISGRVDIRFYENEPDVKMDYTYHVDRAIFDKILLDHAAEMGAEKLEEARVTAVDFSTEDVTVHFNHEGTAYTIKASMIIDATGRNTLVGKQLDLMVKDPLFDQYAVHTWYEGFDRGTSDLADYIFVHFLPIPNTWVWQIPISSTVTSFGVVTQKQNFTSSNLSWEDFFLEQVKTVPHLHRKLSESRRIRPFKTEGDYSYKMTQFAGDRFVLIGDAARFVDPIFSSGVSIALNGARFAAQDIIKAFQKKDFSRSSFQNYEHILTQGSNNWYEFITLYYRLNVLFTYFVSDKRYRYDVLKLLQGDVYSAARPTVLDKMQEMIAEVEQNPAHIWHKLLKDQTTRSSMSH